MGEGAIFKDFGFSSVHSLGEVVSYRRKSQMATDLSLSQQGSKPLLGSVSSGGDLCPPRTGHCCSTLHPWFTGQPRGLNPKLPQYSPSRDPSHPFQVPVGSGSTLAVGGASCRGCRECEVWPQEEGAPASRRRGVTHHRQEPTSARELAEQDNKSHTCCHSN